MSILQEPIQNAIARLRKQHNDDGDYEAKSCQRSLNKDVWESISAFANTHGGTLLLGLDEHNGFTCVQDFHLDRVQDQLIEGMGDGGRKESDSQILQNMMFHVKPLTAVRFS